MANNEIIPGRDGSVTIVSDTAALFGEILGPPVPADDPAKWHPVLMDEAPVCTRYKATPADLIEWQHRFKFPAPRVKTIASRFSWSVRTVRSWVVDELDEFDESIRQLFAHLPRK